MSLLPSKPDLSNFSLRCNVEDGVAEFSLERRGKHLGRNAMYTKQGCRSTYRDTTLGSTCISKPISHIYALTAAAKCCSWA